MKAEALIDLPLIPAQTKCERHILVRLEVPEKPHDASRRPLNMALILDRSGSMSGEKITLAKKAAVEAIRLLSSGDRISVTVYDDKIDTVFPSAFARPAEKAMASRAVLAVDARNSTNLCDGYLIGCKQVADTYAGGTLARALLLTDGLANVGVTDEETIVRHAREMKNRGLVTSTFGAGAGFNEELLRRMAREGGGNFYFASSAAQIPDHIAGEVQESLEVMFPDAVLVIELEKGVKTENLAGFKEAQEHGCVHVMLGSLVSGQLSEVPLRVFFSESDAGAFYKLRISLLVAEGASPFPPLEVVFTVAEPDAVDQQKPDFATLREVLRAEASLGRQVSLENNRKQRFQEARQNLLDVAGRIEKQAHGDRELQGLVSELQGEAEQVSSDMDPMMRKARQYRAYQYASGREASGGSRKSSTPRGKPVVLLACEGQVQTLLMKTLQGPIGDARTREMPLTAGPSILTVDAGPETTLLAPEKERSIVLEARQFLGENEESIGIVFVKQPLSDNWFSHWHRNESIAVASLAGWESYTPAPAEAFVGYEIVLNGFRGFPGWEPEALAHTSTRGCPFDFCRVKAEIDQKLHVFEICPACRAALLAHTVPVDVVEEFAKAVREVAARARHEPSGSTRSRRRLRP